MAPKGSCQSGGGRREYDGRLPLDVGLSLNLVIPRKEEPRKKNGSACKIIAWKIVENKVVDLPANSIPGYQ